MLAGYDPLLADALGWIACANSERSRGEFTPSLAGTQSLP